MRPWRLAISTLEARLLFAWEWPAEFNCCGTKKRMSEEPEKKQMKLSLKRKPLSPLSRFNKTVTKDMIEQSSKGIIPKGMAKATSWAIRTFSDWITQRNKHNLEVFPSDLFDKPYPVDTMISCLQRFVSEARRVDGMPYPPKTLFQILCSLLRHSREHQSGLSVSFKEMLISYPPCG